VTREAGTARKRERKRRTGHDRRGTEKRGELHLEVLERSGEISRGGEAARRSPTAEGEEGRKKKSADLRLKKTSTSSPHLSVTGGGKGGGR